jgi:L-ascorbate metabolism protein UlaG (beta-lactamase superfamily)
MIWILRISMSAIILLLTPTIGAAQDDRAGQPAAASATAAVTALTAETDTIATRGGPLTITFLGHGSLMFGYQGEIIHVDPWSRVGNYAQLPDADLILITHEHRDHLDPQAIAEVRKKETRIMTNPGAAGQIQGAEPLTNGQWIEVLGLRIEAVPAYNIVHLRAENQPYHPPGEGNGYVITFGDRRVYVAGDTENTPEMKSLTGIDVAFLPMNLPYTMTPEMVADAARAFRPHILYPYHFGRTDPQELLELLEGSGIEVRIRKMS